MKCEITLKDGHTYKADLEQGHIENFISIGAKVRKI